MIERSTAPSFVHSFVVRVYRFEATPRQVAGVIEAVDASGASRPFADTTQLGEVLCALLAEENRVSKKPRIGRRTP
jgi:hypothetical protein